MCDMIKEFNDKDSHDFKTDWTSGLMTVWTQGMMEREESQMTPSFVARDTANPWHYRQKW